MYITSRVLPHQYTAQGSRQACLIPNLFFISATSLLVQILSRFDIVGTIDKLDILWQYLCEYMEMDKYPLLQIIHPIFSIPSSKLKSIKCVEFPNHVINPQKAEPLELSPEEEYESNLELAKIKSVVSYQIWEEFSLQFENFIYFFNKTHANIA